MEEGYDHMCETVEKNCKNCEWLMYYDGYFCGKSDSEVSMKDFIEDIENETCQGFQERNGKFWLNEEGPF